jgi:hypothetical protein
MRIFSVGGTGITDAGLSHLKGMVKLEELYLGGTALTDAGLVQLRGFERLKTVFVPRTRVTSDGVAILQKALPQAHSDM